MSTSESESGLVLELAEEFLERYRKGERPSLKEYTDRHPALAEEIREVFPAMAMMENIALGDDSLAGEPTGVMPTAPAPRLEQLGDFRILREVGRGGMGVVYEAEQVSLGRHVALKLLPSAMLRDPRQRQRFEREARSAARLHHTNIVPVFGVGEHDGTPYYVMQFIQGLGLDEVLVELKRLRAREASAAQRAGEAVPETAALSQPIGRRDISAVAVARSLMTGRFEAGSADVDAESLPATYAGTAAYPEIQTASLPASARQPTGASRSGDSSSLSSSSVSLLASGTGTAGRSRPTYWQGVARIGVQVADALDYAHKQGIVHRDIKPSNLLLDNRGSVWVTDFGLAKVSDQQNLTTTGDVLGTLRYMPPEAFEGKADERGDVYSLGLTLYELSAFRPAFPEKDRGRLVRQVTTEDPARLRALNPEIPRDLETIVHKAIDRDPVHRYATAGELAADLQRFLDDEPILARRQTRLESYRRWARRNPGIAALGAVLTGVLLIATVASLVVAGRMSQLAQRYQLAAKDAAQAALEANQARRHEAEQRTLAETARRQAEESAREADAQRRRAEENFGRARRAVDDYFTQVSETQLLKARGLQPLRLELLRSALKFYEEFLKERGDDPALQADLLATHLRAGRIHYDLGQTNEGSKQLRAALEGYGRKLKEEPENRMWKEGLYQSLASSLATGPAEFENKMRRAIALCTELRQAKPTEIRYQKDLADMYNRLGVFFSNASRHDQAVDAYRHSTELRLDLAAAHPDDPEVLSALAQTFNNTAASLRRQAHVASQMLTMQEQAIAFGEAAFRLRPQDFEIGTSLGTFHSNFAHDLWQIGRQAESLREFQANAIHMRSLARDNPAVPDAQRASFEAFRTLASYLMEAGKPAAAIAALGQAQEPLDRLPRENASQLYEVAALRASLVGLMQNTGMPPSSEQAQLRGKILAEAMDFLRRAADAGFRNHEQLRRDARIVPLRGQNGFSEIAGRIEAASRMRVAVTPAERTILDAAEQPAISTSATSTFIQVNRATLRQAFGVLLLEQGKLDEAARLLNEALTLREQLSGETSGASATLSEQAELWLALGDLEQRGGRLDHARSWWTKAQEALARAVSTSPDDVLLWKMLATVHLRLGQTDAAAIELARAMSYLPVNSNAQVSRDSTGVYQAAASDSDVFERVVRLRPADIALYQERATFLARRRNWPQAADVLGRLRLVRPDDQFSAHVEIILRAWIGDAEGYRRVCHQMLAEFGAIADPTSARRLLQALLLRPDGIPDLRTAESIFARMPFDPGQNTYEYALFTKGLYLDRAGNASAALETYRPAGPSIFPPFPAQLAGARAIALAHSDQRAEARRELNRAKSAVKAVGFDPWHEGDLPNQWQDWLRALVLIREAEGLVEQDPIFPADPYAH